MVSRFLRVYLLQVLYALPITFGWGFILLYSVRSGFSEFQIASFYLIHYSTVLVSLTLFRKHKAFRLMLLAFVSLIAGFLALNLFSGIHGLYLVAVLVGVTAACFWVPYNTLFFSFNRKETTALHSGFLFMVFPVMNAIVPLVSGLVIDSKGFFVLFLLSALMTLAPLVYALSKRDDTVLDLSIRKPLRAVKGLRLLISIEGFWQGVCWMVLPLLTFSFVRSGVDYGSYLSYLGVAGAVSVLLLCRISDRYRSRFFFIAPAALLVSLSTVAAGIVTSFSSWIIVNGLISFFIALTYPFTLSVIIDRIADARDSMVSREFFLNLGRISGVLLVMLCIHLNQGLRIPLIIAGLAFSFYPVVLNIKKIYPARLSFRSILSGAGEFKES